MRIHKILLDPVATGGGSSTPPPAKVVGVAAAPLAKQDSTSTQNRLTKVETPKNPPKEVLDVDFNLEQLPTLSSDEGGQVTANSQGPNSTDTKKSGAVKEGGNDGATAGAQEARTDEQRVAKEEASADAAATNDSRKAGEGAKKDEPSLPKYLKPPKSATDKKDDKKDDKTDGIDYTKFSAAEGGYLKNMSREARAFTADLITQNRELSKLKGGTYLQHPDAYTLTPEWKGAVEQVSYAQKEGEIWKSCLEQIKLGKPFKPITGWDNKGNPVFGAEMPPSDSIEEEVRINMQNCYKTANEVTGQMRQYATNHRKQVDSDLGTIETECKARFEWERNQALLDYSVSVDDGKGGTVDKSLKQIKQDFTSLFPAYLRDNIGVRVGANMMIALIIAKAELSEAKATKSVVQTKLDEQKHIEPSSDVRPAKELEQVGGVREFSAGGFEGL